MLRHDWRFPASQDALGPMLATFFAGWNPSGIGSAQPYPTFYYIGFALWPFHRIASPFAIVIFIVTAATVIAAISAHRLALNGGAGRFAFVASVFAVLNPWVYAKMVAGHIIMVLAYAFMLALVAEVTSERPRPAVLILLAALSITQIEFWVISVVPLVIWCIRRRHYAALSGLLVSAVPIVLGIATSYNSLLTTPYNLEWQRAQSVDPLLGAMLMGYQFGYASAFKPWGWAVALYGLVSLVGLRMLPQRREFACVVWISVACFILSTGMRGPISPLYAYAVTHVTESGIFRELYDLIGILAIGYVALSGFALRSNRLGFVCAIAAAFLLIPWITHPVYRWFISASMLQLATPLSDPSTRVAYLPAFQPLSLHGQGSGVDPDAYDRQGRALPFNSTDPTYPIDSALAFAREGDTRKLAALSVSSITSRRQYNSNWHALQFQFALQPRPTTFSKLDLKLPSLPMTVLYKRPPSVTSIGDDLFEESVAPALDRAWRFTPQRVTLDAAKAWVDARLTFAARPEWGNPWGGVATKGSERLSLPSGTGAILAQTSNALIDDTGRVVARKQIGLHWWLVQNSAKTVSCRGECIAVAALSRLPSAPEHAAASEYRTIIANQISSWLAIVTIPINSGGTLRYNVRFDPNWHAYSGWHSLTHFALDSTVNGFRVPNAVGSRTLVLVQTTAAMQLLTELIALSVVLTLVLRELRVRAMQSPLTALSDSECP